MTARIRPLGAVAVTPAEQREVRDDQVIRGARRVLEAAHGPEEGARARSWCLYLLRNHVELEDARARLGTP